MKKKLTPTTVYLICMCIFLFLVNCTLGFVLIKQSDTSIREMIELRMLDIANTAAAMLDGDVLEVIQANDVDTSEYQNTLKMLSYFRDNIDLAYIYCIRDMGNDQFVFSIDPSEDPGEFGEPIVYTDALHQASIGVAAVDKEAYGDRWGRFYSAYAPVFDSNGNVGGIVAVDFNADWYDQQKNKQVSTTMIGCIMSMILAVILVCLFGRKFKQRFRRMLGEMTCVSEKIEALLKQAFPGASTSPDIVVPNKYAYDEVGELNYRINVLEEQLSYQIAYVKSQAFIDGLTGLGNRSAYEENVKQLDDAIKAGVAEFGIALFDLNGLKELNDNHGHEMGDRAIIEMAAALLEVFSEEGETFRIGGDEFVVVIHKLDVDFEAMCTEVDDVLAESGICSASRGYAVFGKDEDLGYRAVFNRADTALYHNKKEYYAKKGNSRRNA